MNHDLTQQLPNYRYFKNKKTSYQPIPDGFVTSAGNPVLAAKYGNNIGANVVPNVIPNVVPNVITNQLIDSVKKI